MAEGKDIPINIKTTSDNSGTDSAKESIEGLQTASKEASKGAGELDQNVGNIARAQMGRSIVDLADKVGLIAAKFRATANEVREYDKAAADALDQTADRIDMVASSVGTLAMGFAVGGPLGAGVAAVGIGVKELMNSFQDAQVAGIKAAASQKKALEETAQAAREAAIEAEARAGELKSQEIEAAIRRQNVALAEGLDLLEKQLDAARKKRREKEEVLSAEDDLALANIDVNQASGKITNEEAEKQRAEVAVAAKKRADDERAYQAFEAAAKADEQAKDKENHAGVLKVQAAQAAILADEFQRRAEEAAIKAEVAKKQKRANDALIESEKAHYSDLSTAEHLQTIDKAMREAQADLDDYRKSHGVSPGRAQSPEDTAAEKEAASKQAKRAADDAAKVNGESEAARKEADKAHANAGFTQQQSADTIATVDEKAEIEAKAREARENARRLTADKKEREDAQKKADDAAKKKASDRERRTGDEAGIGKSALALLPKGVVEEFRQSVTKAAEGLQDGDQGGEIKELIRLMGQLADATQVKGTKTSMDIKNLAERIKKLEQQ